jgi:hypothetical protein
MKRTANSLIAVVQAVSIGVAQAASVDAAQYGSDAMDVADEAVDKLKALIAESGAWWARSGKPIGRFAPEVSFRGAVEATRLAFLIVTGTQQLLDDLPSNTTCPEGWNFCRLTLMIARFMMPEYASEGSAQNIDQIWEDIARNDIRQATCAEADCDSYMKGFCLEEFTTIYWGIIGAHSEKRYSRCPQRGAGEAMVLRKARPQLQSMNERTDPYEISDPVVTMELDELPRKPTQGCDWKKPENVIVPCGGGAQGEAMIQAITACPRLAFGIETNWSPYAEGIGGRLVWSMQQMRQERTGMVRVHAFHQAGDFDSITAEHVLSEIQREIGERVSLVITEEEPDGITELHERQLPPGQCLGYRDGVQPVTIVLNRSQMHSIGHGLWGTIPSRFRTKSEMNDYVLWATIRRSRTRGTGNGAERLCYAHRRDNDGVWHRYGRGCVYDSSEEESKKLEEDGQEYELIFGFYECD